MIEQGTPLAHGVSISSTRTLQYGNVLMHGARVGLRAAQTKSHMVENGTIGGGMGGQSGVPNYCTWDRRNWPGVMQKKGSAKPLKTALMGPSGPPLHPARGPEECTKTWPSLCHVVKSLALRGGLAKCNRMEPLGPWYPKSSQTFLYPFLPHGLIRKSPFQLWPPQPLCDI